MATTRWWIPVEGNLTDILRRYPQPLAALTAGEIPAIVVRQAYNPDHCAALLQRLYERGLAYDPRKVGDRRGEGGYVGEDRLYVGSSLVYLSADPEKFFIHAAQTHELFKTLFNGYDDPVETIYAALTRLAPGKQVLTAHEPDGHLYGPAIFRIYYAGAGHGPHFDSVAKRQKLFNYVVSRFQYQFSGVLCFQNPDEEDESGESFIYNCPWTPAVQTCLAEGKFPQYVAERDIARVQIHLNPGDLYFFYSGNIHEVPPVSGDKPRTVLAVFFGMSPGDEEIFVWS